MTPIREKPIIFNGPMIRAILEGRKTQTRRPIKGLDGSQWEESLLKAARWREAIACPWEIGDRLWVRETFWDYGNFFGEDMRIAGCQLAAHGDKGPNGSHGNLTSIEKSYLNSVTGHSHTPKILRNAWSVGTTSKLKLNYNSGPSSWLHASVGLYENGQKQMYISIEGKWRNG